MRNFRALAGWAKAFMILAILSLFASFSLIGAVASYGPLQDYAKAVIDWVGGVICGWMGTDLPAEHAWLYENVKVASAACGVIFLLFACVFYSAALGRANRSFAHRQSGQVPTSTVVIGSTDESKKLAKNEAKEAEREEKMKKITEIKAEKEAKKAAKKAAKEAAKSAKETADKTVEAAQDTAVAEVAKAAEAAKAKTVSASKSMDDILNSMK